ncbi:MAG: hypothetical protein A3I61_18375 [Acidobacteria bacterium RIFCSPLOWO2_02_FULL_68_18]|nr:MAG: hypothetical protein A3I61_18375 [Acidobacteria bacterium RIFCSPLOWO2_02_FULL_68_18]OFW48117.1 MAG: hypothetical protein A3G77_10990 [Acidobacteria bacterium RIFCSPLOWO2_12_FULL_68_19]
MPLARLGPVAAAQAPTPPAAPARHVDRDLLMSDVGTLGAAAFEGRSTGTPGGLRARQWIVEQFRNVGLQPAQTGGYLQPFTATARDLRAILPGGRPFRSTHAGANVVGRLPGRDPDGGIIAVTAHYDHLGVRDGVVYPGADDNASGIAVLLAAARYFGRNSARHGLVFAALDAEELGLRGARALLGSAWFPRDRVVLNVNLDMVSRNDRNELYAAGPYHSPWQTPILLDVQGRAAVRLLFGHDRPESRSRGLDDWTHSSDHAAFHEARIPFVYFGVEDHPDYHKPTDTADRIDPRFFGDAADTIVEALRTFDARLP